LVFCELQNGYFAIAKNVPKADTIIIWNSIDDTIEKTLEGHTDVISSICLLPDGRLASSSCDGTIRIWNMPDGTCNQVLDGRCQSGICTLHALYDGRLLSVAKDNTVQIWNVNNVNCKQTASEKTIEIRAVCVIPENRVAIGRDDGKICIWAVNGICEKVLEGHTLGVSSLGVLPDGSLVSGSFDQTIRIWNISDGKCVKVLECEDLIFALCVLSDGRLAVGSGPEISLWNISAGVCEKKVLSGRNLIIAFCELPNSHVASISVYDAVVLWDFSEGGFKNVLSDDETSESVLEKWSGMPKNDDMFAFEETATRSCCLIPDGQIRIFQFSHYLLWMRKN
jgi:WD40 repeat protein